MDIKTSKGKGGGMGEGGKRKRYSIKVYYAPVSIKTFS